MKTGNFSRYVTGFLGEYLPIHRNLSLNTIKSYSDVFRLLLLYCKEQRGMNVNMLTIEQLNRELIEDFLLWLDSGRSNAASTINQRLAVLHAFFDYVRMEDPKLMLHCQNVLAIPFRRAPKPCVPYLTADMLQTILSLPDLSTRQGRRDLTLLSVLYDTGARVQELADITVKDIRLEAPASLSLHGKGRKSRTVPLMQRTVALLRDYMEESNLKPVIHSNDPLFQSRRREKLTRAGISYIVDKYAELARSEHPDIPKKITPHVLRHTKAMHLVQANVNLIYIRDLLGHVNVKTTEVYARADSEAKRAALEKASQAIQLPDRTPWTADADIMDWLKSLSSQRQ